MSSSSKKKQQILGCTECGCSFLAKDSGRHNDCCGPDLGKSPVAVVRAGDVLRGVNVSAEDGIGAMPEDATGWIRSYCVLMSPQTMELLGVKPRQPALLELGDREYTVYMWPSTTIPLLKMAFTLRGAKREVLATLRPIPEEALHSVKRVELRVLKSGGRVDRALRDYLQLYLSGAVVRSGLPIQLWYYGEEVEVSAVAPLELQMAGMSIDASNGDGEGEEKEPLLSLHVGFTVSLTDVHETAEGEEAPRDLSAVGGMPRVKETLMRCVVQPAVRGGVCCSVLVFGLPGSGKTLLMRQLRAMLGARAVLVSSMDEVDDAAAAVGENTILLLDLPDWDKEHKHMKDVRQWVEGEKCACVVLAVRSADDLELGMRVRFPVEAEIPVPTEAERVDILRVLNKGEMDVVMTTLAKRTHGFTGGDLWGVLRAARHEDGETAGERVERARRRARPTGIRQFVLEVPNVKFTDIGGNEELKLEIQQAVIWPQKHPEAFARFGIDPPAGILLYGPPGCSKTLVARALANESGMNFLAVKGPELFSKWVGDSEKAVRDLFARARQVAPTIVFLDEIDAVGAARGGDGSSGVSDRVLAQLLTELDGLEKNAGVLLLAATNRPDQLDTALLRPGRLDRSIYVGLPDEGTRRAVIALRTARMQLASDVGVDQLVAKTNGYSGAELVALCRTAAMIAMRESLDAEVVTMSHFEEALKAVVPRTDKTLLSAYEHFKKGNAF